MISLAVALAAAAGLHYQVTASAAARELAVEAQLPAFPDASGELSVDDGAEPFVRDVAVVAADGAVAIERRGDSWFAPGCATCGCTIRYRFALREAATARADDDLARLYGDVVESPPGAWLLRPLRVAAGETAELTVSSAEGTAFAAGLAPGPVSAAALGALPYAAFGAMHVEKVRLDGATLTLAIAKAPRRQSDEDLLAWLRSSAALVARYFGRFPVDGALLLVVPAPGEEVHGRARGTVGASILLPLGTDLDGPKARQSWELVHELVHLGFPSLPGRQHWAEEGLATYVEPIARARAGELTAGQVWRDLVRGLPQGLPQQGDQGLDNTHTWGRTYWGGALFWLLADVEIRERTRNRFGLEHALRAVVSHGGNIAARWPLSRALAAGDRATGNKVLEELYARMGSGPVDVDLDALFRRLGVAMRGDAIELDERAPLAPVRRAITERR
ncbi:MAG: hypothetical protein NVS4B10_19710 [Myxococcales bacterium]